MHIFCNKLSHLINAYFNYGKNDFNKLKLIVVLPKVIAWSSFSYHGGNSAQVHAHALQIAYQNSRFLFDDNINLPIRFIYIFK